MINLFHKMKCLAIGDVHIKLDNINEIELLIQKIHHYIQVLQPDFIILLGDILHTHERIHTTCLQYAEKLFQMCCEQLPTYVLVGNHDYISNSQFLTSQHWMTPCARWNQLTIVDRVVSFHVKGYHIVCCPYVPDGRFVEALDTYPEWKTADLIFGHQTLNGVKMGAILIENVEEINLENYS